VSAEASSVLETSAIEFRHQQHVDKSLNLQLIAFLLIDLRSRITALRSEVTLKAPPGKLICKNCHLLALPSLINSVCYAGVTLL